MAKNKIIFVKYVDLDKDYNGPPVKTTHEKNDVNQ